MYDLKYQGQLAAIYIYIYLRKVRSHFSIVDFTKYRSITGCGFGLRIHYLSNSLIVLSMSIITSGGSFKSYIMRSPKWRHLRQERSNKLISPARVGFLSFVPGGMTGLSLRQSCAFICTGQQVMVKSTVLEVSCMEYRSLAFTCKCQVCHSTWDVLGEETVSCCSGNVAVPHSKDISVNLED